MVIWVQMALAILTHITIEYGMMGAINEGIEAVKLKSKKFNINIKEVAKVYDHGSIIEGKLTHWLYESFKEPKYLDEISCEVPKGETEKEMKSLYKEFNMPILRQAHLMRIQTRKNTICGQFISAIRSKLGGHAIIKKKR